MMVVSFVHRAELQDETFLDVNVCFYGFQDYISEFKFKSVVAQDLIDYFLGYFPELKNAAVAQREGGRSSVYSTFSLQ